MIIGRAPAPATAEVLLHGVPGPPLVGAGAPHTRRFDRAIAGVSGPDALLAPAAEGLPDGAALAEAVALRLRDGGAGPRWGDPAELADPLAFAHERGTSSVAIVRADPSLLDGLQIGGWFDVRTQGRAVRRLLRHAPAFPPLGGRALQAALDAAFWAGVASAATPREWRRLTASAFTALYYHRIAGEMAPGQERLDLPPAAFRRHLRVLRLLRFHALSADDVARFLAEPDAVLPRRSYVLTADDGYRDCVDELRRHPAHRPQLFVPTAMIGGVARWTAEEPLADAAELAAFAAGGGTLGSHSRTHASLPDAGAPALEDEVAGSLADLRALPGATPAIAYPHGRTGPAVRAAAARAGYRVGYTTAPGRNGAGTDRLALRRIGPKAWDSPASLLYRALTGALLPSPWESRLQARRRP